MKSDQLTAPKHSRSAFEGSRSECGLLTRRAFIASGSLVLCAGSSWAAASTINYLLADDAKSKSPKLRIGMLTDCHYADRKPTGTRYYRQSLDKIDQAVNHFNANKAQLAVQLGDFIDAADDVKTEIGYLKTIEKRYARFKGPRHYVLGNHCVWSLTKAEFIDNCAATKPYYSFDTGGFHFVILDACHRADGTDYGRKNFKWDWGGSVLPDRSSA